MSQKFGYLNRMAANVFVFSPAPVLTVTVEPSDAERGTVHLHAGGQGIWQARMLTALGCDVTMCATVGGEVGTVLRPLLEREPVRLKLVETTAANGAYIHDRRAGKRTTVADTPGDRLGRHDLDELYNHALVEALDADVCLLSGPMTPTAIGPDLYERLARDVSRNGTQVAVDLFGVHLDAALDGGARIVKITEEGLLRRAGLTSGDLDDVVKLMRRLHDQGARLVVVSRAEQPALALTDSESAIELHEISTPVLKPADHHGAGDSMTAGVCAGLARGLGAVEALRLGAAAGALNVTRHGLGTGSREPVERLLPYVTVRPLDPPAARSVTNSHPATRRSGKRRGRTEERSKRALIVNDDGVDSTGLHRLAEVALEAGLEVVVAAPLEESSGSGAGLTMLEAHGRVVTRKRRIAGLSGVEVYGVAGSPGFIALIALHGAFGPRPDAVLSGINHGLNTGQAILHSGTVGAAMTGRAHGCIAMAVSAETGPEAQTGRWDTAAAVTARILPRVLRSDARVVWNVNVPNRPFAELGGIRSAELASFGAVQTNIAESGAGYLQVTVSDITAETEPGTDAALARDGYATITALRPLCAAEASLPVLEPAGSL